MGDRTLKLLLAIIWAIACVCMLILAVLNITAGVATVVIVCNILAFVCNGFLSISYFIQWYKSKSPLKKDFFDFYKIL